MEREGDPSQTLDESGATMIGYRLIATIGVVTGLSRFEELEDPVTIL